MAESTPSMARALVSMPRPVISVSTMATRTGRMRAKMYGASRVWEKSAGGSITSGHANIANPATDATSKATAVRGATRSTDRSRATRSRGPRDAAGPRATSSTVSQRSGWSTLATCGAKAGEATTTSAVGPSATTSPSASTTTRSAVRATNSTSCVATTTSSALGGELAEQRGEPLLGLVVEAAGRFVEQHHPGRGRQLHREHQAEPLALGEVAGCWSSGEAGHDPLEQAAAGPRRRAGLAVGLVALLVDGGEVQQVGRRLRHEGHRRHAVVGHLGPSTVTDPPCRRPAGWSAHSSDDFPEPLRPMSATTSPAAPSRSTPRSATTSAVADHQAACVERRSAPRRRGAGAAGREPASRSRSGADQAAGVADRQRERVPAGQPAESDDGRRQGGGRQPGRGGRVRGRRRGRRGARCGRRAAPPARGGAPPSRR